MTAFAPTNTSRLWVKYTSNGLEHEIMFRNAVGGSYAPLLAQAIGICEYLADMMYSADSFVSARYADIGASFSLPIPFDAIVGTDTGAQTGGDPESYYVDFLGRDVTFGAKVRWNFFTRANRVANTANNRFAPGENTYVDAAIGAFISGATNPSATARICAISKGQPTIYTYANSGYNSYWQRQQRG